MTNPYGIRWSICTEPARKPHGIRCHSYNLFISLSLRLSFHVVSKHLPAVPSHCLTYSTYCHLQRNKTMTRCKKWWKTDENHSAWYRLIPLDTKRGDLSLNPLIQTQTLRMHCTNWHQTKLHHLSVHFQLGATWIKSSHHFTFGISQMDLSKRSHGDRLPSLRFFSRVWKCFSNDWPYSGLLLVM